MPMFDGIIPWFISGISIFIMGVSTGHDQSFAAELLWQ